jgi:hypothetical protein
MQPTIHLRNKPGYGRGKYPGLRCKCIVGCIFYSVGVIITREIPCINLVECSVSSQILFVFFFFFLLLMNPSRY